jgi:sec-independent protein translocase protein TatA
MGGLSIWHWVAVAVVVLLLFGRGRISETMGDFGKGIKSFKKGLAEDDTPPAAKPAPPPPQIPVQTVDSTPASAPAPSETDKPAQ